MKSLFTKVFSFGLLAGVATVASAQLNASDKSDVFGPSQEATSTDLEKLKHEVFSGKHSKADIDQWYPYMEALNTNGEGITYFTGNSIMPDSNCVQVYDDGNGGYTSSHVGVYGIGQAIDPRSVLFSVTDAPALSKWASHTVDSVIFFYKYMNANPGVVDTVLIQYFNNAGMARLQWGGGERTYAPTYDKATNRSKNFQQQVKIPISESTESFYDNAITSFSGTMALPTNLGRTNGNEVSGFVVSFIPGMAYNFGDTIVNDSLIQGVTKINSFMPLIVRQGTQTTPAFLTDDAFDYGLFAFDNQKYGTSQWYYPYNIPGVVARQHLYSLFHISTGDATASASELNANGYGLGVAYPNPANSGDVINVPFALGKGETVTIELVDVVGKTVSSKTVKLTEGNHVETLKTEGLNSGIYFYSINAGDFSATKKITIK
ncbi:MAG: T9SS type A sorting domain-containing protein [Bacteroidia bacterium]